MFTWISLAPVAGCQRNIDHLPHGDEVKPVISSVSFTFDQFFKEALHRGTKHCGFISGRQPVAVELDEQPIGASLDGDRRLLPESQASHGWRIDGGEFAVFDAQTRPAALAAAEVDHKRSLNDQRESAGGVTAFQINATAVGRSLIEGRSTLVDRVDLANLRRGRRGEGEVGIATGVGQNLHFFVHAAKTAVI